MTINSGFEKELAELVDGTPWRMADRILEEFPAGSEFGDGSHGRKTGLYAVLDEYEEALRRDYGIELRVKTMLDYRATAIAWPDAGRTASAPYGAHRKLNGRPNRVQILERLAKRHGYVTENMVRNWISEQKPAKFESWMDRIERRLRHTLHDAQTPEAREAVADLLETLAGEMRHARIKVKK
jgi:hypothetical protein